MDKIDPKSVIIGVLAVIIAVLVITRPKPITQDQVVQIKSLVRQAARWSSAAKQDESPLIAVLHANYGVGYLGALGELFTPAEVEAAEPQVAAVGYKKFSRDIVAIQDIAAKRAVSECPNFAPALDYLALMAGEA